MVLMEGDSGDAKPISSEETEKEEVKSPRLLTLESILWILNKNLFIDFCDYFEHTQSALVLL